MRKRKPRRHGVTVYRAKPARLPRNEWDEDDDVEIGGGVDEQVKENK